jgi:hypothetical protein
MHEFDEDELPDEDNEVVQIKSIRARPVDYAVAFFIFLNDIAEALDGFTNMLITITARHANYKNDQTKFADATRLELESLPTTED